MKIFIVIPLHNEKKHILNVLKDIEATGLPAIVVNDGSTDGSADEIRKARLKNVEVLEHKINLGKGAAMKTGCEYAFESGADAVVFMDADGQHQAKEMEAFTGALENGYEVVFGSRNFSVGVPLVRYLGNKAASLLVRFLFGVYVSDLICGYRAITKNAYEKIKWESLGYGVETEMVVRLSKTSLKHCEVPVPTVYYDSFKGVTVLDALSIFFSVIRWRFKL